MRVFILCTGRTGSSTIIKACKHISNFTASHESRSSMLGEERFNYPDNHIEADNRLSWFIGKLENKFGNDAFYVHLKRDKQNTVSSYIRRWNSKTSIVKAFAKGILKIPNETITSELKEIIVSDYYDCVNSNIEMFLQNKDHSISIRIEEVSDDFELFWDKIGATGDKSAALSELKKNYNKSQAKWISVRKSIFYNLKLKAVWFANHLKIKN